MDIGSEGQVLVNSMHSSSFVMEVWPEQVDCSRLGRG